MLVFKFGGTSVGDARNMTRVAEIIAQQLKSDKTEQLAVVVSAMTGVTDELIRMSRMAAARDTSYSDAFNKLRSRHHQTIRDLQLTADKDDVLASGFAEHSCNSCGAPLPETDSIECSYCHSPIQRKNADWLLESVTTSVE